MEITIFESDPEYRVPTIKTDYYPIALGDHKREGTLGTILYNYLGKANTPNVVYASSSSALGNIPLGYQATELYVCPTDEAMKAAFPFLRHNQSKLSTLNGAIVILHRPLTNGVPLYTVFLLEPSVGGDSKATLDIQPLLQPTDRTKKAYQTEPTEIAIRDFIGSNHRSSNDDTYVVFEHETDVHGDPCVVAIFTTPILVKTPTSNLVEGFEVPKNDDPNYTYQECTMMPVDGIYEDGSGDVQYTYQVSSDSQILSSNMENATVFNISGIVLYFIITIAIYFGTPILYSTIMCNILAKINTGISGKAGIVDYLRGKQNFFGLGEYRGLTIVFNILYILLIVSFWIAGTASSKSSKNIWSLYSMVVFFILAWVIGYMGVQSRPLPEGC
jgi:hypothetical protein